ncbi:MAG: tetratricopeptide repeat protein [Terriglobales bacterium]
MKTIPISVSMPGSSQRIFHQSAILLAILALALLPACTQSRQAREHVAKGNVWAAQHQFANAENEYRQAIVIDPKLADAYFQLGIIESQQDSPTAAVKLFSKAVDLDPRNIEAHLRLGNLLVSSAQFEEARRQAEAALSIDGASSSAHRLIGQIELHRMMYAPAEQELKQAIDLAPQDPQAYEDLGLTQLLDAEYGAAEKSFQKAVEVKPDDPHTYINLSGFYKAENNPSRAEQVLRDGMAKNPKAVELPIALASLYTEQGRMPDAKRLLDQIEAPATVFADGRRAVAQFYLDNGDAASALDRFRALSQQNPSQPEPARKVAECYLQLSRWQDARDSIDQFTKAQSASQDDPAFRVLRARADLGALRLRDAASELQSVMKDWPDPSAYYYLAQVDLQQEDRAAAEQALNQSVTVQPGYLPGLLGIGNIHLQQNDATGALQYAGEVIATSFWLADAHMLAGSAYQLRGDLDQAQRAFEVAVGLNPRSPEAELRLAQVLTQRGGSSNPDAEEAYEKTLALAPDNAAALNGLAALLAKEGKTKQASARIEKQIAKNPKAYPLQVAKAEFCAAQKDWSCAERSYQQTLALNPYYVNGYLALAHIYAATNRPQEMIREYEAARTKFPEYLPTYLLLGQVYEYVGDWKDAEQTYQAALNVDPNQSQALTNLSRLRADHPASDAKTP